ncbi:gdp-l-fucose synthetase [Chrysochromulina tobinii]|uniref:Gdp-l-fucose synthetase n=1 Tax=Chrysochromulina tobinii TaxID=1460289 RepID=A0A0M0K020_9EUKA|nr:gdp-l-fucose synthetase [Chrysochromulina tobinii]|eukprot:KOO31927.1 gdp-l-fucose synthetase [Chrysochromulina sp. CCMP291]
MATPPPPPPTNMVVMVTGGSGLVGQGVKANIDREANAAETWIFLTSKDGDLRDKEQTRAIFEKHKPTHVIHLAARVGGLFSNMKYRVEFWRENVAINDNVLHLSHEYAAARRSRCKRHGAKKQFLATAAAAALAERPPREPPQAVQAGAAF